MRIVEADTGQVVVIDDERDIVVVGTDVDATVRRAGELGAGPAKPSEGGEDRSSAFAGSRPRSGLKWLVVAWAPAVALGVWSLVGAAQERGRAGQLRDLEAQNAEVVQQVERLHAQLDELRRDVVRQRGLRTPKKKKEKKDEHENETQLIEEPSNAELGKAIERAKRPD